MCTAMVCFAPASIPIPAPWSSDSVGYGHHIYITSHGSQDSGRAQIAAEESVSLIANRDVRWCCTGRRAHALSKKSR